MFKFSSLIKENIEFEDIEDALLSIYDTYGEPRVVRSNIDGGLAHSLRWDLGFSLNEYSGVEALDKTAKLFTSLSELKSTQKRLTQFDVDFKVSGTMLFVRFIPKKQSKQAGDYKFILGQDWREVQLKYSEIVRFFRDKGFKILNVEFEDNEAYETSSVIISTNADAQTLMEFERIFGENLEEKEVDRSVEIGLNGGRIEIYPSEEKTYVVLDVNF